MIVFVIMFFVLLGWVLLRASKTRRKNFVQSFYYLSCLGKGKSTAEANNLAHNILTPKSDPKDDKRWTQRASEFSQEKFNGKQLPVIQEAASKGFII